MTPRKGEKATRQPANCARMRMSFVTKAARIVPKIKLTYKHKERDLLTEKIIELTGKIEDECAAGFGALSVRMLNTRAMIDERDIILFVRAELKAPASVTAIAEVHDAFIRSNAPSPKPTSQGIKDEAKVEDEEMVERKASHEVCIKVEKKDN